MTDFDFTINGTSLLHAASMIDDISGMMTVGPRRGDNITQPCVDGALYVAKPRAAYTFTVGVVLWGADPVTGVEPSTPVLRVGQYLENLRDLTDLLDAGLLVCERTLPTAVPGVTVTHTCAAELAGQITPTPIGKSSGRVSIDLLNLSGKWTVSTGPGS